MSSLGQFISNAIEFVMPDQLQQLAHVCHIARDLVLPRCKTIARMSDSPYASQVTIVRASRYSSLTCLMYNDKKRTELIHFISANLEFAFGFACHNDDLELAKYICNMSPCLHPFWLFMYAVPQFDLERAKSLMYNEMYNCTHSYRIFRYLYEHNFERYSPLSTVKLSASAETHELDAAIHSGYIKLVHLVTNNLCQIQPQERTSLTYESCYISREIHDYLQVYSWYATYFDEIITRSPYHDAVDALRNNSLMIDWNQLLASINTDKFPDLFAFAITKNRIDIALSICCVNPIYWYANEMSVIYLALMHLSELRHICNQMIIPYEHIFMYVSPQYFAFMSLSTTEKMVLPPFFRYLHQIDYPCDEMCINATDNSIIIPKCVGINPRCMKISVGRILNMLCGQIVNPAFGPNLRNIYAKILRIGVRAKTEHIMKFRQFIIGVLLNDINIVQKSCFVPCLDKKSECRFVSFIMSKQYARMYDSTPILEFLGSSGVFRNRCAKLIIRPTVNAVSAIVRNMDIVSLKELLDIVNQMRLADPHKMMRYIMIECVARTTMKMRAQMYMAQMDM